MAAALVYRLVHHCHLLTIRGNSYWDIPNIRPFELKKKPIARQWVIP
jgi:hypothetical protein